MDSITLLSLVALTDSQLRKLQAVSSRLEIHQLPDASADDVPESLRDQVEIIFGGGSLVRDPQPLPGLKWVQVQGAGVDRLLDAPVWHSDVLITNASGIHATPISERALAMMLAFRARLLEMWRLKQQSTWPDDRWAMFSNPDLRASTLGIVGYGAIGGELARQASALGMRVLGLNRSGERRLMDTYVEPGFGDPAMDIPERMFAGDELPEMLSLCDHVVLLLPLTPATRQLVDATALARMKPTAFFYNFGRGGLVDETALIVALQRGEIAGAGLDVFETEPLPTASALWQLPNVIISPHVGGMSAHYNDRLTDVFAVNLRKYLEGQPLINLVDREHGY